MKFYWIKTHTIIRKIFSDYLWTIPTKEKIVYLTFDDGPTAEITEWVLTQLKAYNAKATFFCIGNNISHHFDIFNKVVDAGHNVGNHTYNHYNGWKAKTADYIENVLKCEEELDGKSQKLFRPPYGKLTMGQSHKLRKLGYKVVMWDILSADFDQTITPEKCLQNVLGNISPGRIIIFHDSVKAFGNLEYALPGTLQFLKENGYRCEAIAG
jgi:peptidoglycan/xylan/chitin deacetylase (PgdA/CDA1 family)